MRQHTVQEWLAAGGRICRVVETPTRDARAKITRFLTHQIGLSEGSAKKLFRPARMDTIIPRVEKDPHTGNYVTEEERTTFVIPDSGIYNAIKSLHNDAPDRIFTIAYFSHPTDDVIYYGASVFSFDEIDHSFSDEHRKLNNQQAVDRACNTPVTVKNIFTSFAAPIPEVFFNEGLTRGYVDAMRRTYLRNCIREHGVHDLSPEGDFDTMNEMLRIRANVVR